MAPGMYGMIHDICEAQIKFASPREIMVGERLWNELISLTETGAEEPHQNKFLGRPVRKDSNLPPRGYAIRGRDGIIKTGIWE